MKKGDVVRISNAESVKSHYGIVLDMLDDKAAFLKVPCREDRERAPQGVLLLGIYYLAVIKEVK